MAGLRTKLAWSLWQSSCKSSARSFETALRDPEAQQRAHLSSILSGAANTEWAKQNRIGPNDDIETFQERVQIMDTKSLGEWTDRIRTGAPAVLTQSKVNRLVPTSGSTGPAKLIPMTKKSQQEFALAIDLWLYDLLHQYPEVKNGRCYIATSPAQIYKSCDSAVPIGFAKDADYLSRWGRLAMSQVTALPPGISKLEGEVWKAQTKAYLAKAEDLSLISIWHPSYWMSLYSEQELRSAKETWPQLATVSSWSDGACRPAAESLMKFFPEASHQAKGLWLTEGTVSIPWRKQRPIALMSAFLEFEDQEGKVHLSHELEDKLTYRPILTNHAGLYRYRLGDLVRVDGFVEQTPSLSWVGRVDAVSDLCGEKLSEAQISRALATANWPHFALLCPRKNPSGYICFLRQNQAEVFPLEKFESALQENPHYKWCRTVGQLGPLSIRSLSNSTYDKFSNQQWDDTHHIKGSHLLPLERARDLGIID
ncbi:MAG: GH3 family domain-containing protein [Opitutales bacterium]